MLTAGFRAMDTDVDLAVAEPCDRAAAAEVFAAAESLFLKWDRTLTRFSEESELSALNRAAGRPFGASPLLFDVVSAAIRAAEESGGVFDPTVLDALIEAGYDKTFAIVSLITPPDPPGRPRPSAGAWQRIALNAETRSIGLPSGVHLDLGGIAKGMAVDAAAALLQPFGAYFVNAGGDLRIADLTPGPFPRKEGETSAGLAGPMGEGEITGRAMGGGRSGAAHDSRPTDHGSRPYHGSRITDHGSRAREPWLVGVQNPFDPGADLALIAPRDCGVATSSIVRRRWQRGGVERHHLIDPRTGTSAETDLAAVTVVAPTAACADVLAKVALILGHRAGRAFVEARGASCLLVGLDRSVDVSPGFPLAAPS
jgi:thiamine biosynthesis lipoprotein